MKKFEKKILPIRVRVKNEKGEEVEKLAGLVLLRKKVFLKNVKESLHLYRKADAWGIDAEVFENEILKNNLDIRIKDSETQLVYEIPAKKFDENKIYLHFKNKTGDHFAQVFCPREFFEVLPMETYQLRELVKQYHL